MAYRNLIKSDGSVFKYTVPGVDTAIQELRPGASFEMYNNEFVKWVHSQEPPTGEEIIEEVKREEKIWLKYEYERNRQKRYPDIEHQLDLLFHDIEEGNLDKTGSFYSVIKAIKEEFPKPQDLTV